MDILIFVISLIASFIFALGGVGAAIILIPILVSLGIPISTAKPVGLFFNTVSMTGASITNIKNRRLDFKVGIPIIVSSFMFAIVGAYFSKFIPESIILILFILFLLFSGFLTYWAMGKVDWNILLIVSVAEAAMNKLGVERTGDSALHAILELGEDHCATCFADGVQVITGCTFGKGNIEKTNKGKWGLTLIDKKTNRAVRVSPKAEAMMQTKKTSFFKDYREKGVPPTLVPDEVVQPLVDKVMNALAEMIMNIPDVFEYEWKQPAHSFNSFACEECGEMVVAEYSVEKNGKRVCKDCAEI